MEIGDNASVDNGQKIILVGVSTTSLLASTASKTKGLVRMCGCRASLFSRGLWWLGLPASQDAVRCSSTASAFVFISAPLPGASTGLVKVETDL